MYRPTGLTFDAADESNDRGAFKKILVDCALLIAFADDVKALLLNNDFTARFDLDNGYLVGKLNDPYRTRIIDAFRDLFAFCKANSPFEDMIQEARIEEIERLTGRYADYERMLKAEKAYVAAKSEDLNALRARMETCNIEIRDHIERIISQNVTHAERRGQLKDLQLAVHNLLMSNRYGSSDIPF